jgi:hypothetical protein
MKRRAILVLGLLAVAGCGDGTPKASESVLKSVTGPHGAMALPIPGDKGYVEPLVERPGSGKPGAKLGAPVFAVYLLQPDGKSPLASAPTSVSANLRIPGQDSPVLVALSPDATGRFVSAPGDYEYDELRGEISLTLDGAAVTVPFAFR